MPTYERILVALDFSRCARDVALHGVELARAFGAIVHLVHVDTLPDGVPEDARIEVAPGEVEAAGPWMAGRTVERLRETFEPLFAARGVSVTSHVVSGPVAKRLIDAVEHFRADLIVMGTHGRQGVARLVLGSVAEDVMRRSPVPVVTVRTQHDDRCAAANCAWCASARTGEEPLIDAETMG